MEGAELTCSHWQVLSASARTRGATELNSRSQIALLGQGYILHITKQISYLIILPSCQWRHGGDSNEQRGGCHSAGGGRPESTQVCQWIYLLQVLLESYSFLFSQAVPNHPLKDDGLVFAHFGASNVICASDHGAGRSKPFPDVFLAAARRLGRDIDTLDDEGDRVGEKGREERAGGLVFEDAIPGMMAGKRAGMCGTFIHLPHSSVFFPFS